MKTFKSLTIISLLLLLSALSISCGSWKKTTDIQKETTEKDTREVRTVYDTIYKDRVITKTLPVYSETIIEAPCDENGQIKPINTTIGSGGNRASIKTINGALWISQYIDSTKQQSELIKHLRTELDSVISVNSTLKEQVKTSEKVVYVYPWWFWVAMIAAGIIGLLYIAGWIVKLYRSINPLV